MSYNDLRSSEVSLNMDVIDERIKNHYELLLSYKKDIF